MRTKMFKTEWHYVANYGGRDGTDYRKYPIPVSNIENIQSEALAAIQGDNSEQLSTLLKQEFVYSQVVSVCSEVGYCTIQHGRGQKNTYSYEEHQVAPILEALFVDNPQNYWAIYGATESKPELRKILLNFSGLDLGTTDLSTIDFSLATFINSNLSQVKGITQEKLDQCISYDSAKLPDNLSQLWNAKKARKVLDDLVKLKAYGSRLMSSANLTSLEKGKLVVAHADSLINLILTAPKHDHVFQSNFMTELHKHDKEYDKHRDYGIKKIIANIALFILGGGVLYAAAVALNYVNNDRVLFFTRTASKERLDQVAEDMVKFAVA